MPTICSARPSAQRRGQGVSSAEEKPDRRRLDDRAFAPAGAQTHLSKAIFLVCENVPALSR
jgi:hypothetical protein